MAVVAACSLTACMDDGYDEPGADVIAAGNNQITEKNVITVQELLKKYPGAVNGSILIEEDIQLKGVITGNDIEGNLYLRYHTEYQPQRTLCPLCRRS